MLLEMHRAADAERMARDLIRSDPDASEPFLLLSHALRAQDRDVEALWRHAGPPSSTPRAGRRGWRSPMLPAEPVTSRPRSTRPMPQSGWSRDTGSRTTPTAAASFSVASGHAREALQCAHEAIRLEPNAPDAHNLAGMSLDGLGRWKGAREAYEETLRLDPHHAFAANNLGALAINGGRWATGAGHVRRALGTNPQLGVGQRNLDVALTGLLWRRCLLVLLPAFSSSCSRSPTWKALSGSPPPAPSSHSSVRRSS